MSVTHIPDSVKFRLWGKAAGRCQYEGCNTPLWLDSLTKAEFNTAYIGHVIADKPNGPRGDPVLSKQLKDDIRNLMLLCDEHHRLIDHEDVEGHPVDRLLAMKKAHERRIEIVSGIQAEKKSHVLLYGANIGAHNAPLSYERASYAMVPEWYPAETTPIMLGMLNSSCHDRDADFWRIEANQLRQSFDRNVRPRLAIGEIDHLSIFALAPQPLLILLGGLLSDIPVAEVYQLHREPQEWKWGTSPDGCDYFVQEPTEAKGSPALVLSLSANITDDRITRVLGEDVAIWRISISEPNNDFLRSRSQLQQFRQELRVLMNRIKRRHGEEATLHVFPAVPVAIAVEVGRVIMPKADLPLRIYDQNMALGGFVHALDLNQNCVERG